MKKQLPSGDRNRFLSIEEATVILGVSRQTLYAYTSRGLVRAIVDPSNSRRSLYDPSDIRVLKERKGRGRSRRDVAASTINWGDPVLRSAITRIADGKLFFRGQNAVELSRSATLEDVAALLWQGGLPPAPPERPAFEHPDDWQSRSSGQRCIETVAAMVTAGSWSVSPAHTLPDAYRILRQLAAAAAAATVSSSCSAQPVHEVLACSWGKGPQAADMIRRALVLCADHELNASAYAARVIASTRASLGAAVLGGLCALNGPLHGGATDLVRALLSDQSLLSDPEKVFVARTASGERVPGFGHRLYPAGDPRAAELLEALHLTQRWRRVVDAAATATGMWPNIDFALVLLEKQLKLPRGAAFAVFATGRAVGWIAHALEQWSDGKPIRPRATYIGP